MWQHAPARRETSVAPPRSTSSWGVRIGAPHDAAEAEADRFADAVVHRGTLPALGRAAGLQRKCSACADEEDKVLRRSPVAPAPATAVSSSALPLSGGQSLAPAEQTYFRQRVGFDFSRIKIHADGEAAASAQSLNAAAYTLGDQIVFGAGRYAPGTPAGRHLLAHELAHVLQQKEGPVLRRQVLPGRSGPNLSGIPHDKWSEQIEAQYRRLGDIERANAIFACRTQGGAACHRLLTPDEVARLMRIARESGGDEARAQTALSQTMPGLATVMVLPRAMPLLGGGAATGATGAAASGSVALGPVALAAFLVLVGIELWQMGRFQAGLRARGFILLEASLAVCITGCHAPAARTQTQPWPLFPPAPPLDIERLRDWIRPMASNPPITVAPPITQTVPRRYPNQTCENTVLDQLQALKDQICAQIVGESCSPSKVSPRRLARRPCSEIGARIAAMTACLVARQNIQSTCFGGTPDPAHARAIAEIINGITACQALAAINCAPGHPMANL